jgi:hypothetical protein
MLAAILSFYFLLGPNELISMFQNILLKTTSLEFKACTLTLAYIF